MEDNNKTEEEIVSEDAVSEETRQPKAMPKWKKFFFIYPSISRTSYVLRALAGAYVAYLAATNLMSLSESESGDIMLIGTLSVILLLCGVHLAFSGAYALIKQEYR